MSINFNSFVFVVVLCIIVFLIAAGIKTHKQVYCFEIGKIIFTKVCCLYSWNRAQPQIISTTYDSNFSIEMQTKSEINPFELINNIYIFVVDLFELTVHLHPIFNHSKKNLHLFYPNKCTQITMPFQILEIFIISIWHRGNCIWTFFINIKKRDFRICMHSAKIMTDGYEMKF